MFIVTPTFKATKIAFVGCGIALIGKIVILVGGNSIYAISTVLTNEIWFVSGMLLAMVKWRYVANWFSAFIEVLFLALSILIYLIINNGIMGFLMGIIACMIVISFVAEWDKCRRQNKLFAFLLKYTMPIFLMHTLFAAPLRSVLLKVGISSNAIYVSAGIDISFLGPIVAAEIMKKTKILEFFLYPRKFIKVK